MNELKIFENNEFGQVRTTFIDGEVYFMLADVCRVLDIKNTRDAKTRLNPKGAVLPTSLQTEGNNKQIL